MENSNSKDLNALSFSSPVSSSAAVRQSSAVQSLDVKPSVRAATTQNITLSGVKTIDGVVLSLEDRVLVKDQNSASQNGVYSVRAGSWVRTSDADSDYKISAGMLVVVEEGTQNSDTIWILTTNNPIYLNTTDLSFANLGVKGSSNQVVYKDSSNIATGSADFTFDGNQFIVGVQSIQLGSQNSVTGNYSTVIGGLRGKATRYGEISHSSGRFQSDGDAQHITLLARAITISGSFTVDISTPAAATFTRAGHSLKVGDSVTFSTTGALPTGLNTTTTYYVISDGLTGSTFKLSTQQTAGGTGTPVVTSGSQSGIHTLIPTASLTLNGATGLVAQEKMVIPSRSTWSFRVNLSAYNSQDNQGGSFWLVGGLRRNLTTTTELQGIQGQALAEGSFSSSLVDASANTNSNSLEIRVTGLANKSVRWVAVVDIAQVSFGTP